MAVSVRCKDCFISSGEYKYLCNWQSCQIAANTRKYSMEQSAMQDGVCNVHVAMRSIARVMMSLPYMGDKAKTYAYAQAIATALTKENQNDNQTNR